MFWSPLPSDLCLIWLMQILILFLNYPHLCVYNFSSIICFSVHPTHFIHQFSFSLPHVTLVKSSQLYLWKRFSQYILFQSLFTEKSCLINIKLCRNQQKWHFHDISDQSDDISSLFGVQFYLSGTIGAFHASTVDDKKINFSLRLDVLFVV